MKAGDIVMVFADPLEMKHPQGQAKLIECVEGHGVCEMWTVEFLDLPDHRFNVLIKVNDEKN